MARHRLLQLDVEDARQHRLVQLALFKAADRFRHRVLEARLVRNAGAGGQAMRLLQHRARGAGKAVVGDKLAVFRHVQAGRPARIERNGAHYHRRLLAGGFGARQRLADMLRQRAAFLLAAERRRLDTLEHAIGEEGTEFGPVQKVDCSAYTNPGRFGFLSSVSPLDHSFVAPYQ